MAARKLPVLAALCALLILTTFISGTQSASCCLGYTRRPLQCKHLTGYTFQTINGSCDMSAVIFYTPSRFICADPSKDATIKAMKCVNDQKRWAQN
ncbi:C-C motif chemokine 20b [Lampris incognitus]|uniref:C-C motif chemokine 20b n=1 Tax=Lampris incognitus TaxID=2546036 RepID=UPI0024B536FC|nr:C-C motif chemokine 20b [Lampris incognitus]